MPAAPPPQETEDDPRVGVDLEAKARRHSRESGAEGHAGAAELR